MRCLFWNKFCNFSRDDNWTGGFTGGGFIVFSKGLKLIFENSSK
jgi:hypothetical protein